MEVEILLVAYGAILESNLKYTKSTIRLSYTNNEWILIERLHLILLDTEDDGLVTPKSEK